jgi:hypothetical protein
MTHASPPGRRATLIAGIAGAVSLGGEALGQAPARPAPARPQPAASAAGLPAEGVKLQFQNAGSRTLAAGVATFAQVFLRGELPRGAGLAARIAGGPPQPVQLDVKTRWEDGSVRMAVLALARPELAARRSVEVALVAAPPDERPPIALAEAIAGRNCLVAISPAEGGGAANIDLFAALRESLAGRAPSYWQRGALTTQARVTVPVGETSLRLVADVAAFPGGGVAVELVFANDRAMELRGGRLNYNASVVLDGHLVVRETVDHGQYQAWHRRLATQPWHGGQGRLRPNEPSLNIRHDVSRLVAAAAIPRFDLTLRIPEEALQNFASAIASPGWGAPLASHGVQRFMPAAGGRSDIGITNQNAAAWLLSQDARAAAFALAWAETAGAVPWRHWYATRGTWLNPLFYPQLWVQSRGGANPTGRPGDQRSTGLTQFYDRGDWAAEAAHQPDLSFVPYLLTGERWILDNLNAQAAWNTVYNWPSGPDQPGERWNTVTRQFNLVVRQVEVRAAAWALRQLENAAWAAPDGSVEQAHFRHFADANWQWLRAQIPEWTRLQGEVHGYIPNGIWGGRLPPWQQDYFASIAILAASRGNEVAMQILDWMKNFLIGRFEQAPAVFNPRDGVASAPAIGRVAANGWVPNWDAVASTWAGFGALTLAANATNGNGWERSGGNFGMWGLSSLAGIWHLTGDPRARAAYERLAALNPPYTTAADFAREPSSPVTIPGIYGGTRR